MVGEVVKSRWGIRIARDSSFKRAVLGPYPNASRGAVRARHATSHELHVQGAAEPMPRSAEARVKVTSSISCKISEARLAVMA